MTLGQRAVNLLYAFRDLAPMTNTLALILLPLALCIPQRPNTTANFKIQSGRLRALYLATFFTNKIYSFIAYRHVGMNRVWNFQSNEIWAAPCKLPLHKFTLSQNLSLARHGIPLYCLLPPKVPENTRLCRLRHHPTQRALTPISATRPCPSRQLRHADVSRLCPLRVGAIRLASATGE
jgi:hypothetical protein